MTTIALRQLILSGRSHAVRNIPRVAAANAPLPQINNYYQEQYQQWFSSKITRIDQETLPTMSQAVVLRNHSDGGVAYLSGLIDMEGADVESQTKNILNKIDHYLAEAGTDKSKLLTATIWLKDINEDFQTFNKLWLEWIDHENKPARATTEAKLAFPNLLVEIQVTALVE